MLYKKNSAPDLSDELFMNPTCEYRGTPFWAWNGKLSKEELLRQYAQSRSRTLAQLRQQKFIRRSLNGC